MISQVDKIIGQNFSIEIEFVCLVFKVDKGSHFTFTPTPTFTTKWLGMKKKAAELLLRRTNATKTKEKRLAINF